MLGVQYLKLWGPAGRDELHLAAPLRRVVTAAGAHQIAHLCRVLHSGAGDGQEGKEGKELDGHGCSLGDGLSQSAVRVDKIPLFVSLFTFQIRMATASVGM